MKGLVGVGVGVDDNLDKDRACVRWGKGKGEGYVGGGMMR